MYTIYLFIHIFTYIYSNSTKWPPSESTQRAARSLLCRTIFLKGSSSMFSANSLTRRRRSHMFLGFCFFTYCVHWSSGERSDEYGGQCERWFDFQISFGKITNIPGNVTVCSILLIPIFFPCCNMLHVLLYCVLQNFLPVIIPIHRSIKPYNRKTPTVKNAHTGHRLFTASFLAFD